MRAFIAHIRTEDGQEQLLVNHLQDSAELSSHWGEKLAIKHVCYLAGLLHDCGKYSDSFQTYLRQAVHDPKSAKPGSVDHSTAGGKLLFDYCHQDTKNYAQILLAELVGNAIISHHSSRGLQDFFNAEGEPDSDYLKRVMRKGLKEYEQVKQRFFAEVISEVAFKELLDQAGRELRTLYQSGMTRKESFFLLKFIYSCLLDADRTNTMQFEVNTKENPKATDSLLVTYRDRLEEHLSELEKKAAPSLINVWRTKLSVECRQFSKRPTGIYSLSIPTGGGKTLASLRFALHHACQHNKQRIIYIVPFTTIIEQNAAIVREILQDDQNILEHHSNIFVNEEIQEAENKRTENENQSMDTVTENLQDIMKDNWDAPIIFTTFVQFLDVIYNRGTRNPRRFHNLLNATLIFDEAQGVPIKCTYLFIEALNFLKAKGQTTSVLCTATQPCFEQLPKRLQKSLDGEMVTSLTEATTAFKRVTLQDQTRKQAWNVAELADFSSKLIQEKHSLLIILNTKSAVLRLYQQLSELDLANVQLFHLSTSMCPAHRKDMLKELREKLKRENAAEKIICVTTQLIEAGVDISFEAVIRSTAGLASIAQAAGRCNRNGETEQQAVYIVNLEERLENLDRLPEIRLGKKITLNFLKALQGEADQLLTTQQQERYFKTFYNEFEKDLVYPVPKHSLQLFHLLGENKQTYEAYLRTHGQNSEDPLPALRSSPKTVAKYFEVIDSPTTSVLVPYGAGVELIADLNGNLPIAEMYPLLKKAQQYSVNVFKYELDKLVANDAVYPLFNESILALQPNAYSETYGINLADAEKNQGYYF